jgi:hypothetical protein
MYMEILATGLMGAGFLSFSPVFEANAERRFPIKLLVYASHAALPIEINQN